MDNEILGPAIRAVPKNELVYIVSDLMPTIGGPDQFDFYGRTAVLKNGRLINFEGSLADAQITVAETVECLIRQLRLKPSEVFKMAITVPAEIIGRDDLTMINGRFVFDLILLSRAFAYKRRLWEELGEAVPSFSASKISALREVLVFLSSAHHSFSSCPANRGSSNDESPRLYSHNCRFPA